MTVGSIDVLPFGMTVGSIDKMRACEERIGQLVAKLEDKGIRIKQWRIGAFNRTFCPVVLLRPFMDYDTKHSRCFHSLCVSLDK
jgi:hypothetical protein